MDTHGLIGLSLSKCFLDILLGLVNITDVSAIVAGTRIRSQEDLIRWFDSYWDNWQNDPKITFGRGQALNILEGLFKITIQPRVVSLASSHSEFTIPLPASHLVWWVNTGAVNHPEQVEAPIPVLDWRNFEGLGLVARIQLLRDKQETRPLYDTVKMYIKSDNRIQGIRLLRAMLPGCGLREAKEMVELMQMAIQMAREEPRT